MAGELQRDLKTLALFISLYCRYRHEKAEKAVVQLKGYEVGAIAGRELVLCRCCRKLLAHAFVKRANCPMDPKPQCKHCSGSYALFGQEDATGRQIGLPVPFTVLSTAQRRVLSNLRIG
jgi:hypothetical protein